MKLTRRELQTMRLVAFGYHNKQIAAVLGISIKTVEKHRQQVLDKLGVDCAIGIVRAAIRRHMLSLEEWLTETQGERKSRNALLP